MYKKIKDYYDYIFPKNIKQLEFIESIRALAEDELVLDVGSATGNLSELISTKARVIGIDLDEGLLEKARTKSDIDFRLMNMLDIDKLENNYDRVVSFGNTLVHLKNETEVREFFKKVYSKLKVDGLFIVQILNYEKILDEKVTSLPLIDNEYIRFERRYDLSEERVRFYTKLFIKEDGSILKGEIDLYPLKRKDIKSLLGETGFKEIEFYSSLDGDQGSSLPLIFKCKK